MKKVKKEKYWVERFEFDSIVWYFVNDSRENEVARFVSRKDAIAFCKMKNGGEK